MLGPIPPSIELLSRGKADRTFISVVLFVLLEIGPYEVFNILHTHRVFSPEMRGYRPFMISGALP
jgi:hypothetical protein